MPKKTAEYDSDCENAEEVSTEALVGRKLRELRCQRKLSLRALAESSGLNVNTLCQIEKGKTSPSVSTLQHLAGALEVPLTEFFESATVSRNIVFTSAAQRPKEFFNNARMENLGQDLAGNAVQPFVVTLPPGSGSGEQPIVHTGHEFVYCLEGKICYRIEAEEYYLTAGDSLVFEAHLPHCWRNCSPRESRIILLFCPADQREEPGGRHFLVK